MNTDTEIPRKKKANSINEKPLKYMSFPNEFYRRSAL